jgi:serine/threonine protein kinase
VGLKSGHDDTLAAVKGPDPAPSSQQRGRPTDASINASLAQSEPGHWYGSEPPPPDEDPLIGKVLANTYSVVRILGEGGMGRVYEAQHTRIAGKRYALKALHPEFARRKDVLVRFQREVEAAASISSPHVVGVYDVDVTEDGQPYLVSELLEGAELGKYLDEHGAMTVGFAVRIARQICKALDAAHVKGIVHRDMKPENVFLTGELHDPTIKVLDFGISRLETSAGNTVTKTGFIIGTPSYMPPEQAKGLRVDTRADVYSVGAILYHCVTGKIPFDRADATATLAAVLTEEPERPRSIKPELPEAFELVVQKAMAREPEARYQTMAELESALAPFDEIELIKPEVSGRVRMTQSSLADAANAAREIAEARPQLLLLGIVTLFVGLFGIAGAIGGVVRLVRGTAALSAVEVLVVLLVLVAALATPTVLLLRHVHRTTWRNTAKVVQLARTLRVPVVVGLAAYGLAAAVLHATESLLLRSGGGIAWPFWDTLLPVVGIGTGITVLVGSRPSDRPGARIGPVGAFCLGASAITMTMLLGIAFRDTPTMPAAVAASGDQATPAGIGSSPAPSGSTSARPKGTTPSTAAANDTPPPAATVGEDAFTAWKDRVVEPMRLGRWKDAMDGVDVVMQLDPNAPRDKNVQAGIIDLAVKACLQGGDLEKRMMALLTERMGAYGVDILFELVATKGGTQAAERAAYALRDEGLRAKGSPDMRIAFDLRNARSCEDKQALFVRARDEGNYRTLRELETIGQRGLCRELRNDDTYKAAKRAIMDRR